MAQTKRYIFLYFMVVTIQMELECFQDFEAQYIIKPSNQMYMYFHNIGCLHEDLIYSSLQKEFKLRQKHLKLYTLHAQL